MDYSEMMDKILENTDIELDRIHQQNSRIWNLIQSIDHPELEFDGVDPTAIPDLHLDSIALNSVAGFMEGLEGIQFVLNTINKEGRAVFQVWFTRQHDGEKALLSEHKLSRRTIFDHNTFYSCVLDAVSHLEKFPDPILIRA